MSTVEPLLEDMAASLRERPASRTRIVGALEAVLRFLTQNNTDENCRKAGLFVALTVMDEGLLPVDEALRAIVEDMGHALHDTHSAPDVAESFDSTPQALLRRLEQAADSNA